MDFKQVETFRVVMQTRSMTAAAAQLHTSQPNISRLIAKLERSCGFKLFERVGLRLLPTPEAQTLHQEVERAFVGLHVIGERARVIRSEGTGLLRIGASPALTIGVVPRAVQALRTRFAEVAVAAYTSDSPTISQWVASGYCDIGLVSYPTDIAGVEHRLMHKEGGVCVVPRQHRLARKQRIEASDLANESFISLGGSDLARTHIDNAFQDVGRKLMLETTHATTVCALVAQGLGVSVVNPLVLRGLGRSDVKAIPFEPFVEFACFSVHAQHRLKSVLATEFIRSAEAVLKQQE